MKLKKFYLLVWTIVMVILATITFVLYPKDSAFVKVTLTDTYDYVYTVGQDYNANFEDELTGYRYLFVKTNSTNTSEYKQLSKYVNVISSSKGFFEFMIGEVDDFSYGLTYFRKNHELLNAVNNFSDAVESMNKWAEEVVQESLGSKDWLLNSWTSMKNYMANSVTSLATLVSDLNSIYKDCGNETVWKNDFTLEVLNVIKTLIVKIDNSRLCENTSEEANSDINNYCALINGFIAQNKTHNTIYSYKQDASLQAKFATYLQTKSISDLLKVY